jgi:ketosteroid isomerase-like protein
MSEANVEIARRTQEALGLEDFRAAARGFHIDATWHNTREFPGEPVCVGVQAIMEFWRALLSSFDEDGTMQVERVAEGDDTVVLGIRSTARGKASGVPLDTRYAVAYRMHDGKVSRADVYGTWKKALEAVGLEG